MPIFTFKCPQHGEYRTVLSRGTSTHSCPKCGADAERIVRGGSVVVTERIDNGMMGRAVERPVGIEEMMDERNQKEEDKKKEHIV